MADVAEELHVQCLSRDVSDGWWWMFQDMLCLWLRWSVIFIFLRSSLHLSSLRGASRIRFSTMENDSSPATNVLTLCFYYSYCNIPRELDSILFGPISKSTLWPATWAEYHCDGIIRRDAVPDEDFRANMVETREQIVADRHKHADETGLERVSSSYRRERRGCWRVSNLTNFLRNQEEKQNMPFCEWLRLSAEHSTPNTEDLKFPILKVSMEVDPRNDCRPAVGSLYNLWKAFGGVIWELPPES